MQRTDPYVVASAILLLALGPFALAAADGEATYTRTSGRGWSLFLRPAKDTPAKQMIHANSLRNTGARSALRHYRALAARWPDSKEAPLALYESARLLEKKGRSRKAFDEYQRLVDEYAGRFPDYDKVLQRQFSIATQVMERRKGRFLFLPGFAAPEAAIPLFERIIENGPQWEKAPEAQYLIGLAQQQTDQYELAIMSYSVVEHRYPLSGQAEESAFGAAYCLYLLAEESPNSEEAQKRAWTALSMFLNRYPRSAHAKVAKGYRESLYYRLAKAAFENAYFYDKVARKPNAAFIAYKSFLRQYPNSEWTELAETRIDQLGRTVSEEDEK